MSVAADRLWGIVHKNAPGQPPPSLLAGPFAKVFFGQRRWSRVGEQPDWETMASNAGILSTS
jgi:hypothetical protein